MSEEFKIEKGIPIQGQQKNSKYPFREMEIGDSFVLKKSQGSLNNVHFCARQQGFKVTTRKIDETSVRVWLISKSPMP